MDTLTWVDVAKTDVDFTFGKDCDLVSNKSTVLLGIEYQ